MPEHSVAGYVPESMIIRLSHDARLIDLNDPAYSPTAGVIGFFFHEFVHYLHNISTVNGIVALINTIDLWCRFRETIDSSGFSLGSRGLAPERRSSLEVAVRYLHSLRDKNMPNLKYTTHPWAVKITAAQPRQKVRQGSEPLLTEIHCAAEVLDREGNSEPCDVLVTTLEIVECAAWLLEKRAVLALDPEAKVTDPHVFPYRVVEALSNKVYPGLSEDAVLACAIAALQSSDAPQALMTVLGIARDCGGSDVERKLCDFILKSGVECQAQLESQFQLLEKRFAGANTFARAVRSVVRSAREMFALRMQRPFFELDFIKRLSGGPEAFTNLLREMVPCAVIQERTGESEVLQRDFLYSFRPLEAGHADLEDDLRVLHAAFNFIKAHEREGAVIATREVSSRSCPFYTSCDLKLRRDSPEICRSAPWASADWAGWESKDGSCWYGTGVRVTRPPPASRGAVWSKIAVRLWAAIRKWLGRPFLS